jgi:hypothetical protein
VLRAAVASAIALSLPAPGVSSAGGVGALPSPATLLARHAPIVVLHPAERFVPVPVDGFLADSDVKQRALDGTWVAAAPGPLPVEGGPWRLDQRLCFATDGLAETDCYAAAEAVHGAVPTVYGAVLRRGDRIALQYWLFYPYNDYSPVVPQQAEFAQIHEGDWEVVTVILDRSGKPLTAGYSRHCSGAKRPWSKVPRRGQRPVVYVALGSHANYFRPGAFDLDPRCWPEQAIIVFESYGKPLRDFTGRGRTVSPRVARVTATSRRWMRFPGTWGEDGYVVFPQVTLTYQTGPAGPAFHRIWKAPVAVPQAWPRG